MNSRFAFSAYVMGYLAVSAGKPTTSDAVAQSLSTNPVVVRRILGIMRQAGLVETRLGTAGGAMLARPAEEISLLDIYCALEGEDADFFSLQSLHPNPGCRVGSIVQETLEVFFGEAENAMKQRLSEVSVAQMVAAVMGKAGDCPDQAAARQSADGQPATGV